MFVVKENLVNKHISVYDSRDRLKYRGRVRAVALAASSSYILLVEVTEVHATDNSLIVVGALTTNGLPNEWEIVKLDETMETRA